MTPCPYCQHAHTSVCGAHRVSPPPAVAVPPAAAPEVPPSPLAAVAEDEDAVELEKIARRSRRRRE